MGKLRTFLTACSIGLCCSITYADNNTKQPDPTTKAQGVVAQRVVNPTPTAQHVGNPISLSTDNINHNQKAIPVQPAQPSLGATASDKPLDPGPFDQGGIAGGGAADNCADANTVCEGTHPYDLAGSTNDYAGSCGATGTAQDVWYRYNPTNSGTATVSTCGLTTGDSVLSAIDACGGAEIVCLDDFCGLQTTISFAVTAGTPVMIRIADFAGGVHAGSINITNSGGDCALLAANNCADAPSVGEGTFAYDLAGATNDYAGTCGGTGTAEDVWYRYIPTGTGQATVSTCGLTSGDSVLEAVTACGGSTITCNDDSCGLQSNITFAATVGTPVMIRIAEFGGGVHSGSILISLALGPCLPDCSTGTPENEPDCGLPSDVVNGGCNSVPPVFSPIVCGQTYCSSAGNNGGTRDTDWYQVDLTTDTEVTWTVTASFDVLAGIVDNGGVADCAGVSTFLVFATAVPCAPATVTACLPPGSWWLFAAPSTFAGVTCPSDYVATLTCIGCSIPTGACCFSDGSCQTLTQIGCVGQGGSYQGDGTNCDSVTCPIIPDNCDAAAPVGDGVTPYCNIGSTTDGPSFCGALASDVWYCYTATCNGRVTVTTCSVNRTYDTAISVYDGCSCPPGALIGCNDDGPPFCPEGGAPFSGSTVVFLATAGNQYLIQVGGFGGAQGCSDLTISCVLAQGACCSADGSSCTDGVSPQDCAAQGGFYRGDGSECAFVTCPSCPPGALNENEPDCGLPNDTVNGGCNSSPPVFSPIACGNTYCGTAGVIDNQLRDTDWYEITVSEDTELVWDVTAEFDVLIGVVENFGSGQCPAGGFRVFAIGTPGTPVQVTTCVPAGTWWLFVAPSVFVGIPCPSVYLATLTCNPCRIAGACCVDGVCTDDVRPADCAAQGGLYRGNGSTCAANPCPVCPPGALNENEPDCGVPNDTVNGGCNSIPPVFSPIACGDTYCGSAGVIDNQVRDTDWYEITVSEDTVLTWDVTAEFDVLIGVVENGGVADCTGVGTFRVFAIGAPTVPVQVSTCVPAGTWWLFVAPSVFVGIPCPSFYLATLTCSSCHIAGACCVNGVCTDDVSPGDCAAQGGSYRGNGSLCADVTCPVCPPDGTQENEPDCGLPTDTVNGGCNSVPPVFSPIVCGQKYCGTAGVIENTTRDTDWYEITLTAPTTVEWVVTAEFDVLIGVVENGGSGICPAGAFRVFAFGAPGVETTVTSDLPAGIWWMFVAPSVFTGVPCGSFYLAELRCVVRGRCCLPDNTCQVTSSGECDNLGGDFTEGEDCGNPGGYVVSDCDSDFEDISGDPDALLGCTGDDCFSNLPIGFSFSFYGSSYSDMFITSNGYISFGSGSGSFGNVPIPNTGIPNNMIAPNWDDWRTDLAGGDIYVLTRSSPTRCIVQWNNVIHFSDNAMVATFQAILYENGCIEFRYLDVPEGNSTWTPTIGVENSDGTIGTSIAQSDIHDGTCKRLCIEGGENPCAPTCLLGDANCDGTVDNGDIDCFVQALLDNTGGLWLACALASNPNCTYDYACTNDLNHDTVVNNGDIDSFVACLLALPAPGDPCP